MKKKRFALVHARIAKNNDLGRIALISMLRIQIRDPLPFLVQGSGMGKKPRSGSGIRIRGEQPGFYFWELRNNVMG